MSRAARRRALPPTEEGLRRRREVVAAAAAGDNAHLLRALSDPAPEARAAAYLIVAASRDTALALAALRLLHAKGEAGPMLVRLRKVHNPAIDAFLDELAQREGESEALAAFLGWGSAACVARHVDRASEKPCPELWRRLFRNHPSLLIDPLVRRLSGVLGAYRKDAHAAYTKAFHHWLPFLGPAKHPVAALLLTERLNAESRDKGGPRPTWKGSTFERLSKVIPEATVDAALRVNVAIEPNALHWLVPSLRADQLLALLATQPESLGDRWAISMNEPKAFFAAHPEALEAALARQMDRPRDLDCFLRFLPREREAERLRGWQIWMDAVRDPQVGLMAYDFATLPPDLRALELRRRAEERPPPASLAPDHSHLLAYLPMEALAARLAEPLRSPDLPLRALAVDVLFYALELCWPERPGDLAPARFVLSTLLDQGDQPAKHWCGWLERLNRLELDSSLLLHEALARVVGVVLALPERSQALSLCLEYWLARMALARGDFALRQMARVLAAWGGLRPRRWSPYKSWSILDARRWNLGECTTWIAAVLWSGGGEVLLSLAQAFARRGETEPLHELFRLVEPQAQALPAQEAWGAFLLAQAEKEGALSWLRWLLLFSRSPAPRAGVDHRVELRRVIESTLNGLSVTHGVTVLRSLTKPPFFGPTPGDALWQPLWAVLPQATVAEAVTLAARAYLAAPGATVVALLAATASLPVEARARLLVAFVRERPRALRVRSPHREALIQALGEAMRAAALPGASTLTPELRGRRLKRWLRALSSALPERESAA